jgi:hypothetical protein
VSGRPDAHDASDAQEHPRILERGVQCVSERYRAPPNGQNGLGFMKPSENCTSPLTYVVHGEPKSSEALAAAIRLELGWTVAQSPRTQARFRWRPHGWAREQGLVPLSGDGLASIFWQPALHRF